MRQTNFQSKRINTFFNVILSGTLISLIAALIYYVYAFAALSAGDHSFDWLLGAFSDFVYIMNVSLGESPYVAADSSYPPFAIIILYPFALICKNVFAKYAGLELSVDELTSRLTLHAEFWIALALFVVICSAATVYALTKLFKIPRKFLLKLGFITLFSAPFIFTVMRGNTIYFALIFTLLFLALKESERASVREIGYLCLVFAGLIKIYPLFFGVFLLCKKKIWASVRIAAYSLILFFASFWIFRGTEDLMPFLQNLGGFASSDTRLSSHNNLSLSSLLNKLLDLFQIDTQNTYIQICIITILFTLFITSAIAAIIAKSDFSRYVIVTSAIILIPPISYFYVLVFAILPFLQFLLDCESIKGARKSFYLFAFLFLFLMPTMVMQNYIIHCILAIAMLITELTGVFKSQRIAPS